MSNLEVVGYTILAMTIAAGWSSPIWVPIAFAAYLWGKGKVSKRDFLTLFVAESVALAIWSLPYLAMA